MQEITLQALLEAGCHFGHKAERWHPKAAQFIYTKKDGIHIIDLAKTKAGLEAAVQYIHDTVAGGGEVLFVGTKRQAAGILKEKATAVSAPYFSERWIGGFLTNWDAIKKNIEKINRLEEEFAAGVWKKYPKHEQSKLSRYVARLKVSYGGVLNLKDVPSALFVIDVRKEVAAVREGQRRGLPVIGVVDTNANPEGIDHVIPANDDAVGSIGYIVDVVMNAYKEGKEARVKEQAEAVHPEEKKTKKEEAVEPTKSAEEAKPAEKKKKARAKKV